MDSLYENYLRERLGLTVIKTSLSFIAYRITGDRCEVCEMYVVPSARRRGLAFEMAKQVEEIAKSSGCKYFLGSVRPSTAYAQETLQGHFAYGLKLISAGPDEIITGKEL